MKHMHVEAKAAADFGAEARSRAVEMMAEARRRGESIRDEGDYLARALDEIYGRARASRHVRGRGKGLS